MCGFLGNGGKKREGKLGDRRKACHGQCAGAFKSERSARAGSSVRATAVLAAAAGGGEPKDAMISR